MFGSTATTASAPSFGAGFGQQPAQQPSFSFGAPAAAPSFGGAGATAPSFSFGAQSATAPTTTQPTTSLFGSQQQPQQASLFGGQQAAASAGLFGGGAQQQQAQQSSLFGGTAAPSFGATTAQKPGLSFGGGSQPGSFGPTFGGAQQQPFGTTSFPLSAPTQPSLGGGLLASAASGGVLVAPSTLRPSGPGIERRFHELQSEIAEYLPNGQPNPDALCATLCYDAGTGVQHAKPDAVKEEVWKRFVRGNPDPEKLSPCFVLGFEQLQRRVETAQTFCAAFEEDTKKIARRSDLLVQSSRVNEAQLADLRARTAGLVLRVLRVAKKLELLRAHNLPVHVEERKLLARFRYLDADLRGPTQKLDDLNLAVKRDGGDLRSARESDDPLGAASGFFAGGADASASNGTGAAGDSSTPQLGDGRYRDLLAALELQTAGLRHLLSVTNTDHRDLKIIAAELRK